MVTLTCNVTGVSAVQQWSYNTENVGGPIIAATGQVPATPLTVGGVEFRLSLLSTMDSPYLASQITFVANENVDGGMVGCGSSVLIDGASSVVTDTTTLQVGSGSM
jgi:hypothetical protein